MIRKGKVPSEISDDRAESKENLERRNGKGTLNEKHVLAQ